MFYEERTEQTTAIQTLYEIAQGIQILIDLGVIDREEARSILEDEGYLGEESGTEDPES